MSKLDKEFAHLPDHEHNKNGWVPLKPADSSEIPLLQYGNIYWQPAQMIRGLEVHVIHLNNIFSNLKLSGLLALLRAEENDDSQPPTISTFSLDGTATGTHTIRSVSLSSSEHDQQHNTYVIKFDFSQIVSLASEQARKDNRYHLLNEYVGKLVDHELKNQLINLAVKNYSLILLKELIIDLKIFTGSMHIAIVGSAVLTIRNPEKVFSQEFLPNILLLSLIISLCLKIIIYQLLEYSDESKETSPNVLSHIIEKATNEPYNFFVPMIIQTMPLHVVEVLLSSRSIIRGQ